MTGVATIANNTILKSDGTFWYLKAEFDYYSEKMEYDFIQICDDVASFVPNAYLLLKKDNSLWNWSLDSENGYVLNKLLEGVICATENNVALTKDGSLYAWGVNAFSLGQVWPDTPKKVFNNVKSIKSVPVGNTITADLKDGTQMTWGCYNAWGLGEYAGVFYVNGNNLSNNEIYNIISVDLSPEVTKLQYDNMRGYYYYHPGKNEDVIVSTMNVNEIAYVVSNGGFFVKNDGGLFSNGSNKIMDGVKVPAISVPSVPSLVANPTASTVLVNGKSIAFDAYNINDNNYFKLRDLAYILNGTEKQFEVGWDGTANAIFLTSGKPYTTVGGEMTGKGGSAKIPTPTDSKILLNNTEVSFTAYNIEGNNYFKLRDIGAAFDFGVDWDGERNTIVIDTSKGYAAN